MISIALMLNLFLGFWLGTKYRIVRAENEPANKSVKAQNPTFKAFGRHEKRAPKFQTDKKAYLAEKRQEMGDE